MPLFYTHSISQQSLLTCAYLGALGCCVDQASECCLEALQVTAAIDGLDAVGKAHQGVTKGVRHPLQ